MRASRRRGLLVVFEGPEGVGKTTQLTSLADRLARRSVASETYREPGGTPLGTEIRRLLLHSTDRVVARAEALLFMAARAQLMEHVTERLADGVVVLLDRFFLSTYAYQIAGRGLDADGVRRANALAVGDIVPDLTLLLTIAPEEAGARVRARGALDRIESEDVEFHRRVTHAFRTAAEPGWQRAHPEVGPIVAIDGEGSPADVARRVDRALYDRWPETFRPLVESQ